MSAPAIFLKFITRWTAVLVRFIPNWQRLNYGFKWLWAMALPVDIEYELTLQGFNDWGPGSPNASLTALPYIAQSRGLIQGEAETADHFAQRLINWRTNGLFVAPSTTPKVGSQIGNTRVLALQLQQFLGNTPTVRIIERIYSTSGTTTARYVTANPDGSISDVVADWDWDSVSGWTDDTSTYAGAVTRTFWCDFWVVVTPSTYAIGASVTPLTGQLVPQTSHDAFLRLLGQFKGEHAWCRAIIWSYNAALFDPASPGGAGNPNGTWGNESKIVAGNQVPARNIVDARYWIPAQGGN